MTFENNQFFNNSFGNVKYLYTLYNFSAFAMALTKALERTNRPKVSYLYIY